ncbi:hypothetical protein M9H77_14256 [Catharanthus roseus]|uniref:Uncharacterized protein n=1 Tax=Catharanthus roseus TaxID=4058 RepID=A0ACC0BMQ3_CATRO|nr:hypothetical protein M9H77_14256 [Catharanthus roseus]
MHNFHHGAGNGVNAYGGNNHGNGNFTSRNVGLPSGRRNDKKETKTDENGAKTMKAKAVDKAVASTEDSRAIYIAESELLECSKEKESEFEKSERVEENECFIVKQESEKEEQRERKIVVLEKSEEVNFYANETNSFFASESLCVHNFEDSSKDKDGKLAYKPIKTINFFPYNSYLFFEIYFKEIKLFSLVFMEDEYEFNFLNSLGTLLEKKQYIEFNSLSCVIPRVDEYHDNVANYASCVLGIEGKEWSKEEELSSILEDLSMSLSLNPSLSFHEDSFVELKSLLEYLSSYALYD